MSNNDYFSKFGSDFQKRFIVALLNDRIFFERIIDIVKPKYFSDSDVYEWICSKIIEIYTKKKIIPGYSDIEILCAEEEENETLYNGIKKELKDIKALQINIDLSLVKEKALEFCKNQEVKNAIIESATCLRRQDFDQIRRLISKALKAGEDRAIGHNYFEDLDSRTANYRENVVPTGWPPIDKILYGGLSQGELGVIIAGPGVGKSTALCNIGYSALMNGKTVIHYTLELSPSMIGLKYDARITGIEIDEIANNKPKVNIEIERFKETYGGKMYVQGYPTRTPRLLNIRSHLQQVINQGHQPDLIIIDYADLIKPSKKFEARRLELEDIYEELRALAGELKCCIWTASQCNRETYEEEIITIKGFSEAFAKAHISDFVISLSRSMKTIAINSNSKGTVFVAKNRVGPTGGIFSADIDMAKAYMEVSEYEGGVSNKEVRKILEGFLQSKANTIGSESDPTTTLRLSEQYNRYKQGKSLKV